MSAIAIKITKQTDSLQKKIDSLSGNYLTNTWKRQQEQKWRDTQIERLRLQKQVLEYLAEEDGCRELSLFEQALLTGAFFDDMRSFRDNKSYIDRQLSQKGDSALPVGSDTAIKRLNKAGINNGRDLRSAIDDFNELVGKATIPPDPNTARIRDLTFKARLFQDGDIQFTPKAVSRQLISITGICGASRVLEPEAGIGSIADETRTITPHVDCVEPSHSFRELLVLKGHNLIGNDLFSCEPCPNYDAVLMNPPFSDECRHIRYAYDFLKPGGILASVCCVAITQSDKKKYTEFREWLNGQCYRFEKTAEKFEMTGVNTMILVIEKS